MENRLYRTPGPISVTHLLIEFFFHPYLSYLYVTEEILEDEFDKEEVEDENTNNQQNNSERKYELFSRFRENAS